MFAHLIHLLESIPAAFWGVVVGALLSLGGVTLTNRASDKRLRAQFEHERIEKAKEREMALRKDVFLAAAEAIAAGINSISRFVDLDLPDNLITSDYIQKSPAIIKVHVIAKMETIKGIISFTGELGALFYRLVGKRLELMSDKNAITLIDSQVADFGKERDRILERMKQQNIEGIVDDCCWGVLQNNFDFEVQRINEALTHRAQLVATLRPKHLEFMRECLRQTAAMGEILVAVLTEVRAELELPFDQTEYQQLVSESMIRQQQAIDEFASKYFPNVKPTDPSGPQTFAGS
ncbi:MAG: hypothetical protein ACRETC_09380 [Gammaproteobacteria bacterium]